MYYIGIIPILFMFFECFRIVTLLLFVNIVYPYQVYNIIALVASLGFRVGNWGYLAQEWKVGPSLYGNNVQETILGRAGFSGNFLQDAFYPLIILAGLWLIYGILFMINRYMQIYACKKLGKWWYWILLKLNEGVCTVLTIAIFLQFKHISFNSALEVIGVCICGILIILLISMVAFEFNLIHTMHRKTFTHQT